MERKRWTELMEKQHLLLSAEEISEGWHFCREWDGLLVGPGMPELGCCSCHGNMLNFLFLPNTGEEH